MDDLSGIGITNFTLKTMTTHLKNLRNYTKMNQECLNVKTNYRSESAYLLILLTMSATRAL